MHKVVPKNLLIWLARHMFAHLLCQVFATKRLFWYCNTRMTFANLFKLQKNVNTIKRQRSVKRMFVKKFKRGSEISHAGVYRLLSSDVFQVVKIVQIELAALWVNRQLIVKLSLPTNQAFQISSTANYSKARFRCSLHNWVKKHHRDYISNMLENFALGATRSKYYARWKRLL